jgi:ribosomal protein L40E
MKVCQGCGCENDDNAERCRQCGTKIEALKQTESQRDLKFNDPMTSSDKWRLWLGAWFLVVLAALIINPSSILATPFFPIGLLVWLPKGEETAIAGWMMGAWVIGWIFYLLFSVIMFKTKKAGPFFIMFSMFCILLILNVVGCQRVMQTASEIH